MLTMLGSPRRCCDGITRRETLKAGALSALGGFGLPQLLEAKELGHLRPGKAKNVILLYLLGGAATQDMYDLKPEAPEEVRTRFQPIPTNVPGIDVCEHLPLTAKWMHKTAVIRSLNHQVGCHNTLPSYTGYQVLLSDNTTTKESYPPSMGSVCEYIRQHDLQARPGGGEGGGGGGFPDYVFMPCYLGWGQNIVRPGPYAGFLGKRYDGLLTECNPHAPEGAPAPVPGKPQTVLGMPRLAASQLQEDVTIDRLNSRRTLLQQIDDQVRHLENSRRVDSFERNQKLALEILSSAEMKSAFSLDDEQPELVDRYGRTLFGQSALIARRLVERGVRFVNVTWDLFWGPAKVDYDAWDTHTNNFDILQNNKLPGFDQVYTALLEDLEARGLLDETLVVVTSEMGRTPRINGRAGRDHWTFCFGSLLAGAGVRGGTVVGESDAQAAYVKDRPVSPSDLCTTIYHLLGIDEEFRVPDPNGRPVPVSHGGHVIEELLA